MNLNFSSKYLSWNPKHEKQFEEWLLNSYWTKNGFMGSPPLEELKKLFIKENKTCPCCGQLV